jgi:hypothetical protein
MTGSTSPETLVTYRELGTFNLPRQAERSNTCRDDVTPMWCCPLCPVPRCGVPGDAPYVMRPRVIRPDAETRDPPRVLCRVILTTPCQLTLAKIPRLDDCGET